MTSYPEFEFPVLCFSKDEEIRSVKDEFGLVYCSVWSLSEGIQIGMDLVDVSGLCRRIVAVKQIGMAPFSLRRFNPLRPRLRRVEHVFEPGPTLSLADVQRRVCVCIDRHPLFWWDDSDFEEPLSELKRKVCGAPSIAAIHQLLGVDDLD